VLSYTQSLSGELSGTGVTATVLCPGPVDTGFGEAAGFSKEDAEAALPAVMWVSPEKVARTAVEAVAAGKLVAIPGLANRAAAVLSRLTPNRLLIPLLARTHPAVHRLPPTKRAP
jgi:short-subunit dehydrogenase